MSAILVPLPLLPQAEAITGQPSFSIPCRSSDVEYIGCNWDSCDPAIVDALEHIPGVVIAETWEDVLRVAGAHVIQPEFTGITP